MSNIPERSSTVTLIFERGKCNAYIISVDVHVTDTHIYVDASDAAEASSD